MTHFPALYTIVMMGCSLLGILCRSWSRYIFILSSIFSLFLSGIFYFNYMVPISYTYGAWDNIIGIEFVYDHNAAMILFTLSIVFTTVSLFMSKVLQCSLGSMTNSTHSVYVILMLLHMGLSGLILTNDIFNLYVFIEIVSLSSYVVTSFSSDKYARVASLEYLVVGSIAAMILLFGIGFILAATGTLNMWALAHYKVMAEYQVLLKMGVFMMILGMFVKLGLFPLYGWQLKTYLYSNPVISSILISTNTVVSMYLLIKILSTVQIVFSNTIIDFMHIAGVMNIAIAIFHMFRTSSLRKLMIYISITYVGYYMLLFPFVQHNAIEILVKMMCFDALSKLALSMVFIAYLYESNIALSACDNDLSVDKLHGCLLNQKFHIAFAVIFVIASVAGVPFTVGFVNKIRFVEYFLNQDVSSYFYAFVILLSFTYLIVFYIKTSGIFFSGNRHLSKRPKTNILLGACLLLIVGTISL